MQINIEMTDGEILGGPDRIAYLKLSLTESGKATLEANDRHQSNNGTPFDEYHGRTQTWTHALSQGSYAIPSREKLEDLAKYLIPLVERVSAGHSTYWNGSNYVGKLTEDAGAASQEIEDLFNPYHGAYLEWQDDSKEVWNASEWISPAFKETIHELGLTANSDEAAYKAAGEKLKRQALSDGALLEGVDAALRSIKEHLQEEAEENEDE